MTRKTKIDQREPKKTVTDSNPVGATHHSGAGYSIGSKWINTSTKKEYVCMDATDPADWIEVGALAATFLGLTDSPSSYVGSGAGYLVVQNATDDGLEIIENSPTAVGLSNVTNIKTNTAADSPTTAEGAEEGYSVGSRWWNTTLNKEFVCLDPDDLGSTWLETTGSAGSFLNLSDTPASYTGKASNYLRIASSADQIEFITQAEHAADHISGAGSEIDGDQIDIDWDPSNYTPATTPGEVTSVDHLTAHLYGIDQALASAGATTFLGLTDTPSSYTGEGYSSLRVASSADQVEFLKHNYAGGRAPLDTDGANDGYVIGSRWFDDTTEKWYICVRNTDPNGAVWRLDNVVLTTKGQLLSHSNTEIAALAVGTDGYILKANSGATHGIEWAAETAGHTHANKTELDLVTDGDHDVRTDNPHSVTAAQAGAAALDHDADHILGGSDEIDGDQLGITWNPTNYTPATTPTEVTSIDHLTAHLYGIDQQLSSAPHSHANKTELDLVTDGDHDVRTDNPHSVTTAQIGAATTSHGGTHIKDSTDQIDGDQLDIDWTPANYTPTTNAQATDVDHLSAHLNGIDLAIASAGGGTVEERFVTVTMGGHTGQHATLAAAISALIADAGGTIVLMAGTYELSSATTLSKTINIIGAEEGVVIESDVTGWMLTVTAGRCHFQNISFTNGAGNSQLLDVQTSENFTISDCKFAGKVKLTGAKSTTFTSCEFDWTSSGYSGYLIELGGNDTQALFDRCFIKGNLCQYLCYISIGTASDKRGLVGFNNCFFEAVDGGGLYANGVGQLNVEGCQFLSHKQPTGSIPPIINFNATGMSTYYLKSSTVRLADNNTTFDKDFIRLQSSGNEADIYVDGLYVDLDGADLRFASVGDAPLYINGSSISIRNLTIRGILLPGGTTWPNGFCIVRANAVNADTTPKQQGHVDFDNCIIRDIETVAGFGDIVADLIYGGGDGHLSFRNCYFDGRDMTQSPNVAKAIEIASGVESVSIKDCVFRGGKWYRVIYTASSAVSVHGCRFDLVESGVDDINQVMRLIGSNSAADPKSTCSVIGNHIIRVETVGHVIEVNAYRRSVVSNNVLECAATFAEYDIYISDVEWSSIVGNTVSGHVVTAANADNLCIHGNVAYDYTINSTGTVRPGIVTDHNVADGPA